MSLSVNSEFFEDLIYFAVPLARALEIFNDACIDRMKASNDRINCMGTLPYWDKDIMNKEMRRIVDMDIPQTVIKFGLPGIPRKDPDFIPAFIVNHILGGGGFSSRLYAQVREKHGYAYSVYSGLYTLDHAPIIYGAVATRNDKAADSLALIEAELARLAAGGPSAEELEAAKKFLTGSYALRFDSSGKIASELVGIQLEGLGIDYINRRNELIEQVTIEQVRAVAARLLGTGGLIAAIVGRPAGLEEIRPGG